MAAVYIGTSGFSYKEWIGSFYPAGIKAAGMLSYYAAQFNTVELNNTFYRLPSEESIAGWKESVTPAFRFAIKAGKRITHTRDFGIENGFSAFFLSRISHLGDNLGPVLFQFPPYFKDQEKAMEFAGQMREQVQEAARSGVRIAPVIEVRSPALLQSHFLEQMKSAGFNICFNDEYLQREDWPDPADIAYLRLRREAYTTEDMQSVAKLLKAWSNQGKTCYVFFKHERSAPGFAAGLRKSYNFFAENRAII